MNGRASKEKAVLSSSVIRAGTERLRTQQSAWGGGGGMINLRLSFGLRASEPPAQQSVPSLEEPTGSHLELQSSY